MAGTVLQAGIVAVSPTIRLVPFEPELLPRVLPWFDHPEVQRRLGGRSWPERELVLRHAARGEEVRGRRGVRAHSYGAGGGGGARGAHSAVAVDVDGAAVAQIGGDVYARWTRWDPATEGVTAVDTRRTMGAA